MDVPKDINYKILLELDDRSLVRFCKVNRKAHEICDDDNFWLQRIMHKYPYIPIEVLRRYKGESSWSNYYIYDLRKTYMSEKDLNTYSSNGRLDKVMILTENGITHPSALINAADAGRLPIVEYLVSKGYKLATVHLVYAIRGCRLNVVKYLVEKGEDINGDWFGSTPLEIAHEFNCQDVIDYLISKGAKTNFEH